MGIMITNEYNIIHAIEKDSEILILSLIDALLIRFCSSGSYQLYVQTLLETHLSI